MPIPRFYCPPPLHWEHQFALPAPAAHHAHRVLRLRVNDRVQVFDGTGIACDAAIEEINGRHVVLGARLSQTNESRAHLHITLAQALCSSEKMDWVVQKATELGAAQIAPVQTQRSVARLSTERAERRTRHWHEVAIAACEQCGRNHLPQVHAPQDFSVWLAQIRDTPGTKFILLPHAAHSLHAQPRPHGAVTLLVGPEGGFSEEEAQLAQSVGFIPLRLGTHVLRTETAAIAGLAALQTLWGDFGAV